MSSLKEIKERIASVKSTLKITSAMKLVSSAKLHQTSRRLPPLKAFNQEIETGLSVLGADSRFCSSQEKGRTTLIVFSSNASLCGSFNANMLKTALNALKDNPDAQIFCIGKHVADSLTRAGYKVEKTFHELMDKPDYAAVSALADSLMTDYCQGQCSKVLLVYPEYCSASKQVPTVATYLPVPTDVILSERQRVERSVLEDYLVEPQLETLRRELTVKHLKTKLYAALVDAILSQHAARMIAMQTASDNGEKILADLTLEYNKSRQAKITAEILDLAGGSQQE